jgi:hypothetical protein
MKGKPIYYSSNSCRICNTELTLYKSLIEGIGPGCKGNMTTAIRRAGEADNDNMESWNETYRKFKTQKSNELIANIYNHSEVLINKDEIGLITTEDNQRPIASSFNFEKTISKSTDKFMVNLLEMSDSTNNLNFNKNLKKLLKKGDLTFFTYSMGPGRTTVDLCYEDIKDKDLSKLDRDTIQTILPLVIEWYHKQNNLLMGTCSKEGPIV